MQTIERKIPLLTTGATIQLQYPITVNGAVLDQLSVRRPLVRDRLIAEKTTGSDIEKEIRLLANLCEQAPETIEQLDMADYLQLQECLAGFLA